MPEDGNSAGLAALLWGLWIYWLLSWCTHLSSLSRAKGAPQSRGISPTTTSALSIPVGRTKLQATVSRILEHCGGITVSDFLTERLSTYETIVAAFDAGDRKTLRRLVSAEVYVTFSEAITARRKHQEDAQTLFAQIAPPEIVAAAFDDTHAEVSIRFVADSYKLSDGTSDRAIGSSPSSRRSIDIWTFGCTSLTRKWRLIATEAEA
ncbi:MAG TPA: Tim44/TimA family putative adaptor protein [Nitrobacter sp.]|nr:Tim44/TimA family putative adaptor protein [Nitrobacter sp.]